MAKPKPIEIARMIDEKKEKLEQEDEAHRLLGSAVAKIPKEDYVVCFYTQYGRVFIPTKEDD